MLRLIPLALLSLTLCTCESLASVDVSEFDHDIDPRLGLIALDPGALDALPGAATLFVELDGQVAGTAAVGPGRAPLEGAPTFAASAGMHTVQVSLHECERTATAALEVELAADSLARLRAVRDADGQLRLERIATAALASESAVHVDRRPLERGRAHGGPLGAAPAASVAALLADPSNATVTPTPANDDVRAIGALVGLRRHGVASQGADDAGAAPPADTAYYSFCSCGKPVPDRAFRVTLERDGAGSPTTLPGHTDRYGLVLVRGAAIAAIDYGEGQRPRPRSYAYAAGDEASRQRADAALQSGVPGEMLTALLDLRHDPRPDALPALRTLLDHADPVVWRAAAVTLGAHDDDVGRGARDAEVARRLALLDDGVAPTRQLFVLGALRRPIAIAALTAVLEREPSPASRREAAWALGFIADSAALGALAAAAGDADDGVRVEVAIALGRLRDIRGHEALTRLAADPNADVARAAGEALAWLEAPEA